MTEAPGFARRGLVPTLVDALGRQIVAGGVPEGSALPIEADLTQSFGVSRTVVREAVRILNAKGLVESSPMRGTRVRPRSSWHLLDPDVLGWWAGVGGAAEILRDLAEIRRIIEPPAARLAAERIDRTSDGELARLEAALAAMDGAVDDVEAFIEADIGLPRDDPPRDRQRAARPTRGGGRDRHAARARGAGVGAGRGRPHPRRPHAAPPRGGRGDPGG